MSAASWILNLWPGLPQLWQRGTWQSLATAVAFSALLNGALLESFAGGSERLSSLAIGLWVLVALAVIVGLLWRAFDQSGLASDETGEDRTLALRQAQTEYLKGHWFEVETRVGELLAANPDDTEARLLLVATLRRSGRAKAARKELIQLQQGEHANHWCVEIHQELKRLANDTKEPGSTNESTDQPQTLPFPGKAA